MAVNLQKGQKISLNKEAGGDLNKVVMGLGWDAVKKKGFLGFGSREQEIDLRTAASSTPATIAPATAMAMTSRSSSILPAFRPISSRWYLRSIRLPGRIFPRSPMLFAAS